jgi:membrane associated rhomboid family serine protease
MLPPPLTAPLVLIASVVVVTVLAWAVKPLAGALILDPYRVRHRLELHRLVTAGWLHADVPHLLFNMFTLHVFADPVVRALGEPLFLALYGTGVVAAHVPTTLRRMNQPGYRSLGASGAVSAVMFSAIALYPGLKLGLFGLPLPVPGPVYALGYLAYSAWSGWRGRDGINHDAHFAGAMYGAIFTYAIAPERVARTVSQLLG